MALNWKEIDRLAQAHLAVDPVASESDLARQLRIWWCIKYSRPFKDPLLDSYTLDELVYEYLTWHYMDPENDPREKERKEQQEKDDQEWARSMLTNLKKPGTKKKEEPVIKPPDPVPPVIPDLPEISTQFKE
jgi:hypothetical protein